MLFKRRTKPPFHERLLAWLWPRRGWRRAWGYAWHRVRRLKASPHAIAAGFAAGVFASFTPFMGFHFVIGFVAAFLVGGSLIASALGTIVGNPLTFPLIWFATYQVGCMLLGLEPGANLNEQLSRFDLMGLIHDPASIWDDILHVLWPVVRPMTVGSVPIGLAAAAVSYFSVKYVIEAFQARRRERFADRTRVRGSTSEVEPS